MKTISKIAVILGLVLMVSGCKFGSVDEGRTVKYEKDKKLVTIVKNTSLNPNVPKYEGPPVTYKMPLDPKEIGPEPKAGGRLNLDVSKQEIAIFNYATQNIETVKFILIDKKENVESRDPIVFDASKNKPRKFPVIDRDKKTITIYSSRQKLLVTFSVPDEYFNLPPETWDAGDVVRIYYKEGNQAHRIMNVSKTDIYKK